MIKEGDIAELKFAILCIELGYKISKPLSFDCDYDFVIDIKGKLFKIQVKSGSSYNKYSYSVNASKGSDKKSKYDKRSIDFIAAYVAPVDTWYLIPIRGVTGKNIRLYPHRKDCNFKYEKYKLNATDRKEHPHQVDR